MTESAYNLLDEKWVPIRLLDGAMDHVGFRELFSRAGEIADLACELPTVSFAIKRLLLAICYRTLDVPDLESWGRIWDSGLPEEPIQQYLDRWSDRFYLFDPQYPFMQAPQLETPKGAVSGLEKIVADIPNGEPFFTIRQQRSIERISPAEGAQWLIHAQAFDPSGIRSGAVGDPEQTNGKGYPIGPSWTGQLGCVWLKGETLDESLVLNLVPRDHLKTKGPSSLGPLGACSWEADEIETAARRNYAQKTKDNPNGNPDPQGYAISRLLTWHSRRIRLFGDVDGVTGVILAQGDKLGPQNMQDYEPMSLWRYSTPQSKKFSRNVYMPRKHEPGRAFWRALPGALPFVEKTKGADGQAHEVFLRSATLDFHVLIEDLNVSEKYPIRIRLEAVGIQYGAQEASIEDIYHDEVDLATVLLREQKRDFPDLIRTEVEAVEQVAMRIGILAANLARAAGESGDGAGDGARDRAKTRFFSLIDAPFRQWLSEITETSNLESERDQWKRVLRNTALSLADELIDRAPEGALIGRDTGMTFMSAWRAESIFRNDLNRILQLSGSDTKGESA